MPVFNFMHPLDLLYEVEESQKKFLSIDLGEMSTGLCIGDGSKKIFYPIKGRDFDGYVLSPLEQILNQNSDGSGRISDEGWFIPNKLFSPQVLNPTTMTVSEMREVLNHLASLYKVEYFIFGFNAYKTIWDDKEKYAFIRKQLKDLEDDGRLTAKWFTFVDESGSTIQANNFLKENFPELDDHQLFFERYIPVRDDSCYQGPSDKNFIRDFAKVRKRILDSYSAYCFTWEFFNSNRRSMTRNEKEKVQKMVDYAKYIGYSTSRRIR